MHQYQIPAITSTCYNLMQEQIPQNQFTLAGLHAIPLYKMSQVRVKAYLRGHGEPHPGNNYRIVFYRHKFFKTTADLLAHLTKVRQIEHEMLGRVVRIEQQAQLVNLGNHQMEKAVAVVLEDDLNRDYVSLMDYVISNGRLSYELLRHYIYVVLSFVKFMQEKGYVGMFNSYDLLFDETTGSLRIDCYGDRSYFSLKQNRQTISDTWQIGYFLYILAKGRPAYNATDNDFFFQTLRKKQFVKFWKNVDRSDCPNPEGDIIDFLNSCFDKQSNVHKLLQDPLFDNYQPLSQQQMRNQLNMLAAQKKAVLLRKSQKKDKVRQNMADKASNCLNACGGQRSSASDQQFDFMEFLKQQQNSLRSIYSQGPQQQIQRNRITVAQLKTILKYHNDEGVKISEIHDESEAIVFKLQAQINDMISIDCEVSVTIRKHGDGVSFVCDRIQGNQFEQFWILNYLNDLLTIL